jgi:hypothetical protein
MLEIEVVLLKKIAGIPNERGGCEKVYSNFWNCREVMTHTHFKKQKSSDIL